MEFKNIRLICLALFLTIQITAGVDRRLQNANQDFLNFEGNRNPSPTSTTAGRPAVQNLDQKSTPTLAVSTSTIKPTTPASPVKQLINAFDKISIDGNPANQGNNRPTTPTNQGQRPNIGIQPVAGGAAVNSPQTKPGTTPNQPLPSNTQQNRGSPNQPLTPNSQQNIPQNPVPNSPSRNTNLPTPGVPPNPSPSWSSIVSGNKQGGSNKPHNISPENTPKTAQNLQPIDIGGGWPLPGGTTPKPETRGPEVMSDRELKELSEELLNKDNSNLARLITINYQGKTTSFSKNDVSPSPLFSIQPAVWNIPTISKMKMLYDNYEQDVTVNEHVTPLEKVEENEFLDAVMATPLMRHLLSTLREKGVVTPDAKQQRDALKTIWFNTYSRGQGKIGSSAFEHIFLSEIKNNEISGLHNWLYFSSEEEKNNVNYLGYMQKVDFGGKGGILKLHLTMKDIDKPVSTMFIGTSPELEMALYSLCFMTRVDRACPLSLGGQTFNLRTHNYRYRGKNMIGSAFPEI